MPKKMSDGIVRPRTVLDCVLQLQHHGTMPAKQRLEETEPDLAEYLLESLTAVYHGLFNLHAPPVKTRKVYRQIEIMTLVCIEALRRSHAELWQQRIDDPTNTVDAGHPAEKPGG